MARMYSGKKGKHGSTKPVRKIAPSWLKYKPFEIEKIVAKMAKEGKSSAQIGTVLRDVYGIPDIKAVTGKKIMQIMKEQKVAPKLPEDLVFLIRRVIDLNKHLSQNNHDKTAKRGLQLTESKIRRLVKYYKKKKVLPKEWKYSLNKAHFLLR